MAKHLLGRAVADIVRSQNASLFGRSNHVGKLDGYRQRVEAAYPNCSVELGFLIEFHSDLRGLFINGAHGAHNAACGELPMIAGVCSLLAKVSNQVDWLLPAFCGGITHEVEDAAIVRCRNGTFSRSMVRQGLERYEYLGLGKDAPRAKQSRKGKAERRSVGDEIHYLIENTSEEIDRAAMWKNSLNDGARAISLSRDCRPFVATLPVLMECYSVQRNRELMRVVKRSELV